MLFLYQRRSINLKYSNTRAADLGTWELLYNSDFKVVEFDHFKGKAGLHTFVLSVSEWVD